MKKTASRVHVVTLSILAGGLLGGLGISACVAGAQGGTPAAAPSASVVVKRLPPASCEDVAFPLPSSAVVATVDGTAIQAGDLPAELTETEARARRDYCKAVMAARQEAVDDAVLEKIVETAAKKEKLSVDAFFEQRLASLTKAVDDATLQKFYEDNAPPDAPPWAEANKEEIRRYYVNYQSREAMAEVVGKLRQQAKVEVTLPQVGPPPPPPLVFTLPESVATAGPKDARVTLVEFADFECPYCARAAQVAAELKRRYAGKIRFAFVNFPLEFHKMARPAAEAAQCAGAQGKFWQAHDALFKAAETEGLSLDNIAQAAKGTGIDAAKFDQCLEDGEGRRQVDAAVALAEQLRVDATPTFILNGRKIEQWDVEGVSRLIDAALAAPTPAPAASSSPSK